MFQFEKQILPSERRQFSFVRRRQRFDFNIADIPELHICYDVRKSFKKSTNRAINITVLVLMSGIESKTIQINSNRLSGNNKNLENSIENLWKIDSYDTAKDANPSLLPRNQKKP